MENKSEIIIYKTEEGNTVIDVQFKEETVWLNLMQISKLFERDKSVISRHISNVFKERELTRDSTVANFATVQKEGERTIERSVDYYNLDVIISVGYRVNSKRGTQFRIWANKILKEFLVRGYALNEKRLKEQSQQQLLELQRTVKFIHSVAVQKKLTTEEASGLLNVISDYTLALNVLDQFDHEQLKIEGTAKKHKFSIDYKLAINAVETLRSKFISSTLFGKEKDESFKSSLITIYQTFDKKELYPSVEEKAAHLLYFVIKNHSFVDGNKRIAAFLFVWFIERNGLLYRKDGSKRIADNALVALTLLIASSKSEEKELMVKVVVNLINKLN
jgi:prophage maintenance system killer protein